MSYVQETKLNLARIRRDNEKREKRARLVEREKRKYSGSKRRWNNKSADTHLAKPIHTLIVTVNTLYDT